ncbi:MAG: outer membrane beta-barrel domain-containing protein [Deltaproteobacteria bacterium]|nr:outer membrane beta-barrel domain-containing protein [Deltaproteobacteria bacterium]
MPEQEEKLVKDAPASAPEAQDRIKAVPRKAVLKLHRFELAAFGAASVNDAYYTHLAGSGSILFHLHDAFALGVGADYLYAHPRGTNVDVVRFSLTSVPAVYELPKLFAHVDFFWTPIYGKVSIFDDAILHFDFYASMGGGMAMVSSDHRMPAVNLGVGQRFFLSDWIALRWEVRDHLFVDDQEVNGLPRSDVQSYVMFMLGASIYFPFSFEYSYR